MDTTALIAVVATAVTLLGTTVGLFLRFMTRMLATHNRERDAARKDFLNALANSTASFSATLRVIADDMTATKGILYKILEKVSR